MQDYNEAEATNLKEPSPDFVTLLEFYKLELYLVLPRIASLSKKAQAKQPLKFEGIKKTLNQTIEKLKVSVINQHAYDTITVEEFDTQFSTFTDLTSDTFEAIHNALDGRPYTLLSLTSVADTGLTLELFHQIMSKLYATIRFVIYRKFKDSSQTNPLSEQEFTQ